MDLSSPSSSPEMQRKARFDFLPLPRQTFEQTFGKETTFLDDSSFHYKDEVIKYFNNEATPTEDAEDFLDTLQAVLEATTPLESKSETAVEVDPVKEAVRSRFIDLYRSNQVELQEQVSEHDVYAEVPREEVFETGYVPYAASLYRHDPMQAEIENYLNKDGSEVIEKYLARRSPADPCNYPDEFYTLYKAVLENCPKATPFASSSSSSAVPFEDPRATLRSKFDRIYEANQQGLGKCWAEDDGSKAREIDQLRSTPFVTHFSSPPTMQFRRDGGFSHSQTRGGYPSFSSSSFSKMPMHGGRRSSPPGGGGGGNPIVKGALLLLALYLGYRFVAQPAYQWIRGNKTTPVGE